MEPCHSRHSRASRAKGCVRALRVLVAAVAISGGAEPLETRMARAEFERAGLHKLDAAELRYLNAWLRRSTDEREPAPALDTDAQPEFGDEQLNTDKGTPRGAVITTRIKGRFHGWDGATIFRLANGQVWRQRVRGRYRHAAEDPPVRIERGRFGYFLVLLATGRRIGVARVE